MKLTQYLLPLIFCTPLTPVLSAHMHKKKSSEYDAFIRALRPHKIDVTYQRRLKVVIGYARQHAQEALPTDITRCIVQYFKIPWLWQFISSGCEWDDNRFNSPFYNYLFINPTTTMYTRQHTVHIQYLDETDGQVQKNVQVLSQYTIHDNINVAPLYEKGTSTSLLVLCGQSTIHNEQPLKLYAYEVHKGKLQNRTVYSEYPHDYMLQSLNPNLAIVSTSDDDNPSFQLLYKYKGQILCKDYTRKATKQYNLVNNKQFTLSDNNLFVSFFDPKNQIYKVRRCEINKIILGKSIWKTKYFAKSLELPRIIPSQDKLYFMPITGGVYLIDYDQTNGKEIIPILLRSNDSISRAARLQDKEWLCIYYHDDDSDDDDDNGHTHYMTTVCKLDGDRIQKIHGDESKACFLVVYGFYRAVFKYICPRTNDILGGFVAFY